MIVITNSSGEGTHKILQQLHTSPCKRPPCRLYSQRRRKVRSKAPAADAQKRLQISIRLLMEVQLLQVAKEVHAGVGRNISIPDFLDIREGVRQVRLAGLVVDACKGV